MEEIYKDIKDLEGKYQVSNFGNIMSLNYRNTGRAELLKPREDKDGYYRVGLSKKGKKDWFFVHRLVAEYFLPNPDNLPQVNHRIEGDEGKKTNIIYFNEDGSVNKEKSTIEWCDGKYNHNYGTINERISKANTNGKCSKRVLQFTLDGEFVREYPSTHECERNGFDHSTVGKCCNGKLPHYKGFRWMYK